MQVMQYTIYYVYAEALMGYTQYIGYSLYSYILLQEPWLSHMIVMLRHESCHTCWPSPALTAYALLQACNEGFVHGSVTPCDACRDSTMQPGMGHAAATSLS